MVDSQHRWTDKHRSALVERVIVGELTLQEACQKYSLSMDQVKEWVRIYRREARQALDAHVRSALSDQGLELEDFSAAEFSGNLGEMSVAELIQTIEMGRRDAVITIDHDGSQSSIWCSKGDVVDAEAGHLSGELAVYRLLGLSEGIVNADFSTVHRVRIIERSSQALLMEAARRTDEAAQLRGRIGNMNAVYGPSLAALAPGAELPRQQTRVLRLFNGMRSVEEVVAASDLGDLETLTEIEQLIKSSLLSLRSIPGPLSRPLPPPPESDEGPLMPLAASRQFPKRRRRRPMLWGGLGTLGAAAGLVAAFVVSGGFERNDGAGPTSEGTEQGAAPAMATLPQPQPRPCPAGMAFISGGKFYMGSDSDHPAMRFARPAHQVTLDSFCLDEREVSISQFNECSRVGECERPHRKAEFPRGGLDDRSWELSQRLHSEQCNEGKEGREDHPANCVSHFQARQFCAFRGARLPTEAEWEFAARGTDGRVFPWGDENPDATRVNACGAECVDWHREVGLEAELHGSMYDQSDEYTGTAPVGSFPKGATSDGIMDLIGNVFEWTDGGLYDYSREPAENPKGPTKADKFVIRGGAFNSGIAVFSNPALRFAMTGASYSHGVGFRCAADPQGLGQTTDVTSPEGALPTSLEPSPQAQ